ncbi:unnamed protein product [Echinostoma caproni]|uniref:Protein kinase domain-containing protein n=1 Tax=Echinostoma caproni TaxID=27848 RepID=A0A3P8H5E3_9TREM|nr:unnamed protein product [Echinostoma caproni]
MADFGVAGQLNSSITKRGSFVGTPFWMAPELIQRCAYDFKLAKGEPPNSDLHPIRALLFIPHNPPPQLTGDFSRQFRDFVESCLTKVPENRPTAHELLRHPFIKRARKNSILQELIERYRRWREEGSDDEGDSDDDGLSSDASKDKQKKHREGNSQNSSAETLKWIFDTVRASPAAPAPTAIGNSQTPETVAVAPAPVSATHPAVLPAAGEPRQSSNVSSSSSSSPSRNPIPQDRRRGSDPSINSHAPHNNQQPQIVHPQQRSSPQSIPIPAKAGNVIPVTRPLLSTTVPNSSSPGHSGFPNHGPGALVFHTTQQQQQRQQQQQPQIKRISVPEFAVSQGGVRPVYAPGPGVPVVRHAQPTVVLVDETPKNVNRQVKSFIDRGSQYTDTLVHPHLGSHPRSVCLHQHILPLLENLRGVYDQIRNGAADSIDELVSAFEAVDSASPQYTTNFLVELLSRALDSNPRISSNVKRRALDRLKTGSS